MPFGGLLTVGLLGATSSLTSGILGSNAAKTAASEQVNEENQALNFQENVWNQEQANAAPYLSMGTTSMGNLMSAMSSGKFNMPAAPSFNQTFTAPTLQQAEQQPGYQFAEQQGSKSIMEGAAAAGGAISGGTMKAMDQYNQNLAETDYSNVFNQALQTYGAGLQGYQANLQGYQANLSNLAQQYQEMYAPVQLGEAAATGLNQTGQSVSTNVGNLMGNIGSAQAAGTVGSTNALTSGLTGSTNSLMQSMLMSKLFGTASNPYGSGPNGAATIPSFDLDTASLMGLTNAGPSATAAPGPG